MKYTFERSPGDDGRLSSAASTSNRQNRIILDPKLKKKRETDRLAQRASRERTKNRIAYLEALVKELRDGRASETETDCSYASLDKTNGASRSLIESTHLQTSRKRKTLHRQHPSKRYQTGQNDGGTVSEHHAPGRRTTADAAFLCNNIYTQDLDGMSITSPQSVIDAPVINNPQQSPDPSEVSLDSLIRGCLGEASRSWESNGLTSPLQDPAPSVSLLTSNHVSKNTGTSLRSDPVLYPTSDPLYDLLNFDPGHFFWRHYKSQHTKPFLQPPRVLSDREKWHSTDSVYKSAITSFRDLLKSDDSGLSSAPFVAVIQGWNTLDEKERTHPVWASLHWIDECVFGSWQSNAQRIALMFLKHRLMLYLSNPTKGNLERVPVFMRPRPSQETIQHPVLIDFLIWPSLRDRLVFHHHMYSTGAFSKAYSICLRFNWPFGDAHILKYNIVSQTWGLSELFERYASDVSNWTMTDEFFNGLAEMRLDIPSEGGRSITL